MDFIRVFISLWLSSFTVNSWVEVPKFSQMRLMYPGYYKYGGKFRDKSIYKLITDNTTYLHTHDTASLRMSYVLNRYGGRHSIGKNKISLSKHDKDSITGRDGQQYIFRNTAFGPYLAHKYGDPQLTMYKNKTNKNIMSFFIGKRGIVRLVSYNERAGGHIGLWDCDTFFQSKDWSHADHIISSELWESPDSYCPPPTVNLEPKLVELTSKEAETYSKSQYIENFHKQGESHKLRHAKYPHG